MNAFFKFTLKQITLGKKCGGTSLTPLGSQQGTGEYLEYSRLQKFKKTSPTIFLDNI